MRRPSPATLIAFLALCVALSGIAYAQSVAPDSVGPVELQEPSVSTKHVVNRSLRRADFARGQIPRGPRGRQGRAGATNVVERQVSGEDVPAGEIRSVTVRCEGNERATGAGGEPVEDQVGAGQDARVLALPAPLHDALGIDDHERAVRGAALLEVRAERARRLALGLEV